MSLRVEIGLAVGNRQRFFKTIPKTKNKCNFKFQHFVWKLFDYKYNFIFAILFM